MSTRLLMPTHTEQADPLFTMSTLLPLGQPFVHDTSSNHAPSALRPFGLRYVVVPSHPIDVDLSSVRYDTERQMCVDQAGTPMYAKHTDGKTNTQTSDGHKSMDADTDHTED
jgi:putative ATP-grasp target RiPP